MLDKSNCEKDVYHGLVSFVPDLNPLTADECWKLIFEKDYSIKIKAPARRMEFLFLLDCSQTMANNDGLV